MKVIIAGDICITHDGLELVKNRRNEVFDSIKESTHEATASIFNMECPATNSNKKIMKIGPNHKTTIEVGEILKEAGFTHASIANNHIWDFGTRGYSDTVDVLHKNGMEIVGCKKGRLPYAIIENQETKVGILSFCDDEFNGISEVYDTVNVFDPLDSFELITHVKSLCDYLIILYHSGMEKYKFPTPYLQKVCRKMIDVGADFITCQHSHCIGCEEIYQNRHILYGQGNTFFYRSANNTSTWNDSILVDIDFEADISIKYLFFSTNESGIIKKLPCGSKSEDDFFERSKQITQANFIEKQFQEECDSVNKKSSMLSFLIGKGKVFNALNRITKGKLFDLMFSQNKTIAISNVIRCSTHNEVVREILKNKNFKNE